MQLLSRYQQKQVQTVSRISKGRKNTLGMKTNRRNTKKDKIAKLAYLRRPSRPTRTGCKWWKDSEWWCKLWWVSVSVKFVLFEWNTLGLVFDIAIFSSAVFSIDSIISSPATHKQSMMTKTTINIWNLCEDRCFWIFGSLSPPTNSDLWCLWSWSWRQTKLSPFSEWLDPLLGFAFPHLVPSHAHFDTCSSFL